MGDSTPGTQPAGRSRKRWLVAAGVSLVVVAAAVCAIAFRSTTPPLAAAEELGSALLDASQINAIMGASAMRVGAPAHAPTMPTSRLSKPECLGALATAQLPTYAGSGYTGFRWTEAKEAAGAVAHYVAQAVAVYPNVDLAQAYVTESDQRWNTCADQKIAALFADKSAMVWKLGTVSGQSPQVSLRETRADIDWTCQRALRAVNNVVVDATACAAGVAEQGVAIADAVAAKFAK